MPSKNLTPCYRFGEKVIISNVDSLTAECSPFFASKQLKCIVFDLKNLRICDTYGIQFFLECQRKAGQSGQDFILYRPGSMFKQIMKNAGLLHIFSIVDSVEES